MVGQDLTKFTIVLVLLGGIVAIAIFRPQILPAEAEEPTSQLAQVDETTPVPGSDGGSLSSEERVEQLRQHELDLFAAELDGHEVALDQRKAELDEWEVRLNQRQAALDLRTAGVTQGEAALEEGMAELARLQAELRQLSADLDVHQAELDERAAALDQRQTQLNDQETLLKEQTTAQQVREEHLNERESQLRAREASLAERSLELEGRRRWSVAALGASGLLVVPSVMVGVTLMRNGLWSPRDGKHRVPTSDAHPWEEMTQRATEVRMTQAQPNGGNGRDKERTGYPVYRR